MSFKCTGRAGEYSTVTEHMPEDHQKYLELTEKYSDGRLEAACKKALSYTSSPSYKSIKNILATGSDRTQHPSTDEPETTQQKSHGITRGA